MLVNIRMKNGKIKKVRIPIPEKLDNLGEDDYIKNWIADNIKESEGWYL